MSKRLGISQPTASQSAERGEKRNGERKATQGNGITYADNSIAVPYNLIYVISTCERRMTL